MIDNERKNSGELTSKICDILQYYPENFQGLGKLRDHQVKLYCKTYCCASSTNSIPS